MRNAHNNEHVWCANVSRKCDHVGSPTTWPPDAAWRRGSTPFECVQVGLAHDCPKAFHAPRPRGRNSAVVEVPTAATGSPDRALRRGSARFFELGSRTLARRDLTALARAEQLDELQRVLHLALRHID